MARLLVDDKIGANKSSSSVKPAIFKTVCSLSSRITSTTSSIVIRPSNILFLSTTGADTRSLSSNIFTTSPARASAAIEI